MRIAIIPTLGRGDTLAETVCDGLIQLERNGELEFRLASEMEKRLLLDDHILSTKEFATFARSADLLFLFYSKKKTNTDLVDHLGLWEKTCFFDGSEAGQNNRFDFALQQAVLDGTYKNYGGIREDILKQCTLYFRREKPYRDGIIPFPFGIETSYVRHASDTKKDIDFVCVFGQDEYPLLRRYAREELVRFCEKNGFSYHVEKTKMPEDFRQLLARAKVGISVGGGGFDTLRFWEILGNNCLLMTETIDIYQPDSHELDYERIWQFGNLYDFRSQLERVGHFLRTEYRQDNLSDEYAAIIKAHSSVARARTIIDEWHKHGAIGT